MMAKFDRFFVERIVKTFPENWEEISCAHLFTIRQLTAGRVRKFWNQEKLPKEETGGVYAFLLAKRIFKGEKTIILQGPRKTGKIPFTFKAEDFKSVGSCFVAYVGKAQNIKKRLKNHFESAGEVFCQPFVQVQKGLFNCGMARNSLEAMPLGNSGA